VSPQDDKDWGGGLQQIPPFGRNDNAAVLGMLLSMPNVVISPSSTVANGLLHCFGGTPTTSGTTADNYVQIYQP